MTEQWKEILNYEGLYEVSNMGNIRNSRTGRRLSLRYRKDNHIDCMLYKNGYKYTIQDQIHYYLIHCRLYDLLLDNYQDYL